MRSQDYNVNSDALLASFKGYKSFKAWYEAQESRIDSLYARGDLPSADRREAKAELFESQGTYKRLFYAARASEQESQAKALRDRYQERLLSDRSIQDPDEVLDLRYVPDLKTDKKGLVVKSGMGTGKTQYLKRCLSGERKVLLAGHRKSLLGQSAKELGLDYYEGLSQNELANRTRRLAITLDSLKRLTNYQDWFGATVVLDEASQVLQHLHGETLAKKGILRETYELLKLLVLKASKVILLDADMSQTEVEWLSGLLGRENVHVVVNQAKTEPKKFLWTSHTTMFLALEEALTDGKKCYVYCDSMEGAKELEGYIEQQRQIEPQPLALKVIHSDTSQLPETQAFIKDINAASKTVDLLIASPSLGTGVDISNDHFDLVFAYYKGSGTQSPSEMMQGIARVRKPKEGRVIVGYGSGKLMESYPSDAETVKRHAEFGVSEFHQLDFETGALKPIDLQTYQEYLDLYVKQTSKRNYSIHSGFQGFEILVETDGHSLEPLKMLVDGEDIQYVRESIKEGKEARRADTVSKVLEALDIEDSTREELKAKKERQGLTDDERHKLDRASIQDYFKVALDESLVDWALHGQGFDAVKHYELWKEDLGTLQVRDTLANLKGRYATDQQRLTQKAMLLNELLPEYLLDLPKYTKNKLSKLGYFEILERNAEAIEILLGVKVDPTKPIRTLGFILKKVGLEQTKEGKTSYKVTQESKARMAAIYEARKDKRADRAQTAKDKVKNAYDIIKDQGLKAVLGEFIGIPEYTGPIYEFNDGWDEDDLDAWAATDTVYEEDPDLGLHEKYVLVELLMGV